MNRRHFLLTSLLALPGLLAIASFATQPTPVAVPLPGSGASSASAVFLPGGFEENTLEYWKRAPRIPITDWPSASVALEPVGAPASDLDGIVRSILHALENGTALAFTYVGDPLAETSRRVTPALLFRAEGYPGLCYITGYCHLLQATRTFCLDRMREVTAAPESLT